MLGFLGRTWSLWWGLAIVLFLRWHHVMVAGSHVKEVANEAEDQPEEGWAAEHGSLSSEPFAGTAR